VARIGLVSQPNEEIDVAACGVVTSRARTKEHSERHRGFSPQGFTKTSEQRPRSTEVRPFGQGDVDGPRGGTPGVHQALAQRASKRPIGRLEFGRKLWESRTHQFTTVADRMSVSNHFCVRYMNLVCPLCTEAEPRLRVAPRRACIRALGMATNARGRAEARAMRRPSRSVRPLRGRTAPMRGRGEGRRGTAPGGRIGLRPWIAC